MIHSVSMWSRHEAPHNRRCEIEWARANAFAQNKRPECSGLFYFVDEREFSYFEVRTVTATPATIKLMPTTRDRVIGL